MRILADREKNYSRLKSIADGLVIAYNIRKSGLGRGGSKELIERYSNRFSTLLCNVCDFGVGLRSKNIERYIHEKLRVHQLTPAPPLLPINGSISS